VFLVKLSKVYKVLEVILFASWLLDGLQWCLYKQGDIETEKKSKENNKTRNQARSEYSPLTDTSHSVLCYHSNETRAPIANLRNSAQLWGTPTMTCCLVYWYVMQDFKDFNHIAIRHLHLNVGKSKCFNLSIYDRFFKLITFRVSRR